MLILSTTFMLGCDLSWHLVFDRGILDRVLSSLGLPGWFRASELFSNELLGLFRYPPGSGRALHAGTLPLRCCAARFACKTTTWRLTVPGCVVDLVTASVGAVHEVVADLGGHLDTTFRGWSATLAARVSLVISRLVLIFALHLDFHGRVRVVRSMCLPAALHGLKPLCLLLIAQGSFGPLFVGWCGHVVSLWLVLELCYARWMRPLGVTLHFV